MHFERRCEKDRAIGGCQLVVVVISSVPPGDGGT